MTIKSMTKPQLLAHIEQLNAEVLKQGFEISAFREQLAMARPVAYKPTPYVRRPLPQHFAAARALAIASGRSVKCGS